MSNLKWWTDSSSDEEAVPDFPKGMRVLAVDGDVACLKMLETMLQKCGYHVETTDRGITALEMLRKNKFDLVISDVKMQDMDGFEFLKLVGIEMDLPVILVSAYGDNKLVAKGFEQGACDCLIKPLRIEEMRNIWKHVIRKNKKMMGKRMPPNEDTTRNKCPESSKDSAPASMSYADCSGSSNRKRKGKVVVDEKDDEETESDYNKSAQKRSRIVWSLDLHRKFVSAVNQLGLDRAVPKKILDLMEVEGITRENVGSHLQKYRLHLKNIDSDPNLRNQYMPTLGKDTSHPPEGFTDSHIMLGSSRLSDAALAQYMPSMLNNPNGLDMGGLSSSFPSSMGQLSFGASESFRDPRTRMGSSSAILSNVLNNRLMVQGSLSYSQSSPIIGHSTFTASGSFRDIRTRMGSSSGNPITEPPVFSASGSFHGSGTVIGSSSGIISSVVSNPSMDFAGLAFAATRRFPDSGTMIGSSSGVLRNVSSSDIPVTLQGSTSNTQNTRGIWNQALVYWNQRPLQSGAASSSNFLDHNLSLLPNTSSSSEMNYAPVSQIQSNPMNLTFNSALLAPQLGLRANMQNQASLIGNTAPNVNYTLNQRWGNNENHTFEGLMNATTNTRTNETDGSMNPLPSDFNYNQLETFDDLLNAATNQGQNDANFDDYSFGPCG